VGIISYTSIAGNLLLFWRLYGSVLAQSFGGRTRQDIAEYAVMLAVILVLVIGTVRLIGGNANNVFPVLPVLFRSDWRPSLA